MAGEQKMTWIGKWDYADLESSRFANGIQHYVDRVQNLPCTSPASFPSLAAKPGLELAMVKFTYSEYIFNNYIQRCRAQPATWARLTPNTAADECKGGSRIPLNRHIYQNLSYDCRPMPGV